MDSEPKFTYTPLARQNDIRLLHVKAGKDHYPIKCQLECVTLNIIRLPWLPSYTAISYTWGSQKRNKSITIDGRRLQITTSAYEVLQQVRSRSTSRLVWIDFICINQDDNTEKSYQVRLMDQIFSHADTTFAWLGPAFEDAELAISYIKFLGRKYGHIEPKLTIQEYFASHRKNQRLDKIFTDAALRSTSLENKAVRELFSSPWWRRIWVFQEVVLSRSLQVFCGQHKMTFSDIYSFVSALSMTDSQGILNGLSKKLAVDNGSLFAMVAAKTAYRPQEHLLAAPPVSIGSIPEFLVREAVDVGVSLAYDLGWRNDESSKRLRMSTLLGESCRFGATDPRDHVYGLLGIANQSNIVPDYDKSVEGVYTQVTGHLIQNDKSLKLLQMAGHSESPTALKLPSWVPNYSQPHQAFLDDGIGYSAGRNDLSNPLLRMGSISLRGRIVDSILHLGLGAEDEQKFERNHWYRFFEQAIRFTEAAGRSEDALWRTLVVNRGNCPDAGLTQARFPAPKLLGKYFQRFRSLYLRPQYRGKHLDDVEAEISNDPTISEVYKVEAKEFWRNLAAKSKRLAVSSLDDLALVPFLAEVGDLICILHGGSVPFLIREACVQSDGNAVYTLVGECYVHGLMGGRGMMLGFEQDIILI